MNFQQILDVTATLAGWAILAVALWWWIRHGRRNQAGPGWVNWVLYAGQAVLCADAWVDPESQWWAKGFFTATLVILTASHLYYAYVRWEAREREKAFAKLMGDNKDDESTIDS